VRHLGLNHGLPHEIDSFATVVFQIVTAMLSGEAGPSQQFPGQSAPVRAMAIWSSAREFGARVF
jgi:hypothetical protein